MYKKSFLYLLDEMKLGTYPCTSQQQFDTIEFSFSVLKSKSVHQLDNFKLYITKIFYFDVLSDSRKISFTSQNITADLGDS